MRGLTGMRNNMHDVDVIMLGSDQYSPMSSPHRLPALHWHGIAAVMLERGGPDEVEGQLQAFGWSPQWRFGMYKQAHYHSTTHELLVVIAGHATIQLGGTDERARPSNAARQTDKTVERITLRHGDVLLLPAGYTHRAVESHEGFCMIGSYPANAEQWDMRFPNVMGCPHDCEKIRQWTSDQTRKGLLNAQSPEQIVQETTSSSSSSSSAKTDDLQRHWHVDGNVSK